VRALTGRWSRRWSLRLRRKAGRCDSRFMPLAAKFGDVGYWQSTGKWPDFCTDEQLPYDCKTGAARATSAK
jgi:hypothetical protein